MENLYTLFLLANHQSIDHWTNRSSDLANSVLNFSKSRGLSGSLIHIKKSYTGQVPRVRYRDGWNYHNAIIINELVHDAWIDNPMKLDRYLMEMFGDQRVYVRRNYGTGCEIEEMWEGGIKIAS